jgi:hypothetical protein
MIAVALFARTRLSLRQALLSCLLAGIAILPLVVRNFSVSATVGGARPPASRSWLEIVSDAGIGLANLFLPNSFFSSFAQHAGTAASLLAGLTLAAGALLLLVRATRPATRVWGSGCDDPVLRALAVVSLTYLAVMVVLGSVMYFDSLTTGRLLLPLLPVLVLLAASGLVNAWSKPGVARMAGLGAALGYAALAVILGWRGPFLRLVYPDLDYVARVIETHAPLGACLAFEQPNTEALWSGRLVRLRLPEYRAVYAPDELFTSSRPDLPDALVQWGNSTACRYIVSVAQRLGTIDDPAAWTFPRAALEHRVQGMSGPSQTPGAAAIEVTYRDARVSILRLPETGAAR